MPIYDLTCGHPAVMSFKRFDAFKASGWTGDACPDGCVDSRPISVNQTAFYGAWRINDKDFKDASEASGEEIKSSHDIDRLEKAGKMYAVTNPSRARSFKEKR